MNPDHGILIKKMVRHLSAESRIESPIQEPIPYSDGLESLLEEDNDTVEKAFYGVQKVASDDELELSAEESVADLYP